MKIQDIKLSSNGDLAWFNGDFAAEQCTQRHIKDTAISFPGNWRFIPRLGVGIASFLNAPADGFLKNKISTRLRASLESQNMNVETVNIDGQLNITVNAEFNHGK